MLSSVKSVKSVVLQMRSVRAWSKTPKLLRRRASRAFAFVEKVKGEVGKRQEGNARNGGKSKTVKSSSGELSIAVPRDRNGTFQPILVPKRQRRIGNFDDLIISLYTRGMTTRRGRRRRSKNTSSRFTVWRCRLSWYRRSPTR